MAPPIGGLLVLFADSQLSAMSEDVQKLLETEPDWGFNIIELEQLTKKTYD